MAKKLGPNTKSIHQLIYRECLKSMYIPGDLDCVHTMPEHSENGEKCDGSKIWASVNTIPEQFENGRNLDGKNSLQHFDSKEAHLHPKRRSVSFQKLLKMFFFHHFQVFTRCRFQNVSVRVPFSKSTVFNSAGKKCAVFVGTGGLSVEFLPFSKRTGIV